jgi:hypothetical protein
LRGAQEESVVSLRIHPSCRNVPSAPTRALTVREYGHGSILAQVLFARPAVDASNRPCTVTEFERSALAAIEVVPAVARFSIVQNRQSVHEGTAARWTEQVRSRYVRVRGDRQFRPGRHDSASLAANDYASGSQLRQSLDVFLPSPAVQPQKRGRSIHFDRPTTSKGTISRMRPDIRALPQINSC